MSVSPTNTPQLPDGSERVALCPYSSHNWEDQRPLDPTGVALTQAMQAVINDALDLNDFLESLKDSSAEVRSTTV